jgi:hypothetical protein
MTSGAPPPNWEPSRLGSRARGSLLFITRAPRRIAHRSNTRVQEHMAELQRRLARSHTDSKVMFQYRHTIKGYAIHDTVGDVVTYLQTLDADIAHIEPK